MQNTTLNKTNLQNKASLIWNIADKIRGTYNEHEYGNIILPFVVLRRFDCILEDTKAEVLKVHAQIADDNPLKSHSLKEASGYAFYNTSEYTFQKLIDDPNNIVSNFRDYLQGFSENVRDILECFELDNHIDRLEGKGNKKGGKKLLYPIIKEFAGENLGIDEISNIEMGYIFEEIIRKFSESHNASAGQFYTPREVIELMTHILFCNDASILSSTALKSIYDPACGTGGMLSVAQDYIKSLNPDAKLHLYGQELNRMTWAICQSDMLIKNNSAKSENIALGDTLTHDGHHGERFDYIISNPPFGGDWKDDKSRIEEEVKKGRFSAGLPPTDDSQMLFLQHAIDKMNPKGGRVAIIHNASPLFSGDAGKGESEIRKYILENDFLEAIIALPNEIFYNTPIASYILILTNQKEAKRKNKVQLINANGLFERRRKSLGKKRNDISQETIKEITRIYKNFEENAISQIHDTREFGYTYITIQRPKRDEEGQIIYKAKKMQSDSELCIYERVPFTEDIQEYFQREVLPYAPDAWIDESKHKEGYEIPFTRYFYQYTPPKSSSEIRQELQSLESQATLLAKKVFS